MFEQFAKALFFKLVRIKLWSTVYHYHYWCTISGKYLDYDVNYMLIHCVT